jgi:ABC-type transport system substrate-binding protein
MPVIPSGFEVEMNCPNDRYVNDGEICQAVAGMLARVGVKVNLEAESKGTYFPKILSRNTSFYLLGWTPATYDAHNAMNALMASPNPQGRRSVQPGQLQQPEVRRAHRQGGAPRPTQAKRTAMIHEAFRIHSDDIGHLPLHQQALAWGDAQGRDDGPTCRQPGEVQVGGPEVTQPATAPVSRDCAGRWTATACAASSASPVVVAAGRGRGAA